MKRLVVAALLCFGGAAVAQPMMIDPSRMSGMPRPDPAVPAGTVTVLLIHGSFDKKILHHPVELSDESGHVQKTNTDGDGRATFSGLGAGPYVARATDDGTTLTSQSIEMPPQTGVRLMLVFPLPLGTPDGAGRPDKSLPPGTVVVKAQDGDGKPLTSVQVVIGHARKGENQVVELKAATDDKGEARFDNLSRKPEDGYLPEVLKDKERYAGKPFRLVENMGERVVIEVRPVSKDLKMLQIGEGSHFILDVSDDAVQVVEVLRLQNLGVDAFDAGPGGLHIPLPSNALSATVGPQSPPTFSVTGHEAVWKGPLKPGDTELQVMFVIAYKSDSIELEQPAPIPFTEVNVVTEKIDGMSVDGAGLNFTSEEREVQGRKLMLYRGQGVAAGGTVHLTMNGLPHTNPIWRNLAAAVTLLLFVGFGIYAFGGAPLAVSPREALEKRRDHLLEELAALDAKGDGDAKRHKRRDELADKLAKLYKEIDEVSA
jgi:hypothetical protein